MSEVSVYLVLKGKKKNKQKTTTTQQVVNSFHRQTQHLVSQISQDFFLSYMYKRDLGRYAEVGVKLDCL
jgi:hypothetical protein